VVEGRDIGTVVFPDAPVKVFLTADEEERARRRAKERGEDPADISRRSDAATPSTGRGVSPMTAAEDAVVLDTTDMTIGEVVDTVVGAGRVRSATLS
jgi:cytidylate kinase